jgi:DNA polymerase III delta prime subunit
MNPFEYIKALDHHAYFIHSFKDSVHKLKEYLKEKFDISHTQNPDFYHEKFETLGIDDSRKIKESHLSKSFTQDGKRIFVIEASNMTHEAQNSLLKIFEEPHEDSHFFLIMPSVHILLPTLRSRLSVLNSGSDDNLNQINFVEIENFLKLSKKDKIAFVDELAKDISDEKKQKSDAQEFLTNLELVIYKKYGLEKAEALKAILKARDYLNDRSPSIKQLLEYVVLSL